MHSFSWDAQGGLSGGGDISASPWPTGILAVCSTAMDAYEHRNSDNNLMCLLPHLFAISISTYIYVHTACP